MKILKMDYRKMFEIEVWLGQNVGDKGVRWWIDSNYNQEGERVLLVNLDLTQQEEDDFLTMFLLSNV